MRSPEERLKRYRERAEDCLTHAEQESNPTLRAHYMQLAESFLKMAEVELAMMHREESGDGSEKSDPE